MTDEKPQELLIIKRVRGGGDGHHGGAWKIAFADFMTAMMALFLVLWLLSATNEKTKSSVARYFNPVKLVDLTVQKRGLNDPKERPNEAASDNAPPPSIAKAPDQKGKGSGDSKAAKPRAKADKARPQPTRSEAVLFRDPYAVLAEIAGSGPAVKSATPVDAAHRNVGAAASFQDPFQTATPDVPRPVAPPPPAPAGSSPSSAPQVPAGAAVSQVKSVAAQQETAKPADTAKNQPSAAAASRLSQKDVAKNVAPAPAKNAAVADAHPEKMKDQAKGPVKDIAADNPEVARLRREVAQIVGKGAARAPGIEVQPTRQGVMISLTDGFNYAMFAVGSAEPQRRTVLIMQKIAQILAKEKGSIIISGHTDGRRYKSRTYDNWRLSTARAQMALYMLVRGGLPESRVEKIEGASDHELKDRKDPLAAENRRIEILLQEPKS
ncbi:MotB family protein [Methylovirgula sp. HY1]|uniref:MotB family protein n=1 Tax=Methylovirgula sp. HY1 TaxID=2822761 RepID=UPI001C5A975F|nr:MotB family protein [Methylovirgula sp. HY1]QXX74704.1 Chemotaxis protein LafU [Methylovirgula sp. HY1]